MNTSEPRTLSANRGRISPFANSTQLPASAGWTMSGKWEVPEALQGRSLVLDASSSPGDFRIGSRAFGSKDRIPLCSACRKGEDVEILVNAETYGGGGIYGLYATAAANSEWADYLFIHEFGHHFAGLADEYYTSSVAYETGAEVHPEPWEPNVTALGDPATDRRFKEEVNDVLRHITHRYATLESPGAFDRGRRFAANKLGASTVDAVHGDDLSRDVVGVANQVEDTSRDIVGITRAAERNLRQDRLLCSRRHVSLGPQNRTRGDAVHPYFRGEVLGERSRQHRQPGFCRPVYRVVPQRALSVNIDHVDDRAAGFA